MLLIEKTQTERCEAREKTEKEEEGGRGAGTAWLERSATRQLRGAARLPVSETSGRRASGLLLLVDGGDGMRSEAAGSSSPWLATRGTRQG